MEKPRLVVGRHSVLEALMIRPQGVRAVFIEEGLGEKPWLREVRALAKRHQVSLQTKKSSFFKNLSRVSQGVACEVQGLPAWPDLRKDKVLLLALDGVTDPQNLGAIFRTSWLMGVDGILVSEKDSSPLSPTVCKVACGGVEHVPIQKVRNLKQEISDLKDLGFWSYALAVDEQAQSIKEVPQSEKTILIAGAEEKGIKPSLIKDSDFKVYLPQKDAAASYNVSVSVALGLWSLK